MVYSEEVLNEFFNPQNVGVIKGASGKGKIVTLENKEIFKIYIQVEDGKIVDAKFQTFGCTASIAATSKATSMIIGKTLDEANAITAKDILKELGGKLPEGKEYCVATAEETIKNAIANYYKKSKGEKDLDDED